MLYHTVKKNMKIAVIGAGLAGLCATKHCLAYGYDVTTFEKTNSIGGTWVYTDNVDKDEFGLDVHTSMYQNLKSNFPKEIMGFPDFEFTGPDHSYVSASEVLDFIKSYAEKFQVEKHIKFRNEIIRVRPRGQPSKWEVMVRDLTNGSIEMHIFDAVMCCNGHYSCPKMPNYPGQNLYKGKMIHSHSFRNADTFKGETVLVIGSGASAIDIAYLTSKVTNKTTISYHDLTRSIPNGIVKKPDIKALTEHGVEFVDESFEEFTVIIFATGYLYSFPFLSMDCGITIDDNYIQPLYKHCININYPTMALIGMPYLVHPSLICHLQIQLFMKYLSGEKLLPTAEEMLQQTNEEMEGRRKKGLSIKQAHMMGIDLLGDYYTDISTLAGMPPPRPVLLALYRENSTDMKRDHVRFRENNFKIIDDEHFERDKEML